MANVALFSQIIGKLDREAFNRLVKKHSSDKYAKGCNSWSHLVSMLFCQFAKSSSVRDISNGLRSATGNLNHLGNVHAPSKSTLSYQNKHRSWELFKDYYYVLLGSLGKIKGQRPVELKIKSKVMLLDSTVISLCLSLFDWAKYRTTKGAVKMHTLLDYENMLPAHVHVSTGEQADNKAAQEIPIEKGSVVVGDRFYQDFHLLNVWDSSGVFFVVRHKENLSYKTIQELDLPEKTSQHITKDEIIELLGQHTGEKYKGKLRRVAVYSEEHNDMIEILTNNLKWSAQTIADLYKSRWQVEIFFREIKQLLHIKSFIGTSQNAVMIQLWTALITILLLKALKASAKYAWYLSNLVAFIRLNLFVKIDLQIWLDQPFLPPKIITKTHNQGVLF